MGEGFNRFKRRIRLNTILKSVLYGASLGVMVCAVLTVLKRLAVIDVKLLACIATGVLSAVIFGALMYFLLRQSNKKIARTLDRELGLKEKVKTMLDFGDEESAMLQLQREDANARLMAAPTKGYATRRIWIGILTLLLSAALMAGALLIPQRTPEPPYDPDYDMSDYEVAALVALIEHVKKSGMTTDAKNNVVEELEDLIDDLDAAEKESQKKEIVITAINDVSTDVDDATSYDQIGAAMVATKLDNMLLLNAALSEFINSQISPSYEELRATLSESDNRTLAPAVLRFSSELDASTRDFTGNKSLPLYAALTSLSRGMATLSENMISKEDDAEYTPAAVQDKIDNLFELAADVIDGAMVDESANINEGKYVVAELMRIFGITQSDLSGEEEREEDDSQAEDASSDKKDDDEDIGDGGAGDGELIFGSDDVIYDPESDDYKKYGEVLEQYSPKMYEMINEGNLSDEAKDYIKNYLMMLYNGVK